MESPSSFVVLAATLLLHLAAIAAVIPGSPIDNDNPVKPLPIATELLPVPVENTVALPPSCYLPLHLSPA